MVCFVILHYIAADETIKCVDSILQNVNGEKKIIVVDNSSPNDSYKEIRNKYSDCECVDVIKTDSNIGFAKGNNFGYEYTVSKYSPDFIVVMNNDMEIEQSDFIDKIIESYEKNKFHIMGPDIYSTKKKYHQNPQTRKILGYDELKKLHRDLKLKEKLLFMVYLKALLKGNKNSQDVEEDRSSLPFVDTVKNGVLLHGSCYVFSKKYIDINSKECFYPETFMYMEAEILYYLAIKNKYDMIYDPSVRLLHHEDASTNATFKKSYKKSVFSIKCLRQSTKAFLDLMEKSEGRK